MGAGIRGSCARGRAQPGQVGATRPGRSQTVRRSSRPPRRTTLRVVAPLTRPISIEIRSRPPRVFRESAKVMRYREQSAESSISHGIARDRRPRSGRAGSRTRSDPAARPAPGTERHDRPGVPACCRAAKVAAGVRPRSRSTRVRRVLPITADDRDVEHRHLDVGRVAAHVGAVAAQDLDLAGQRRQIRAAGCSRRPAPRRSAGSAALPIRRRGSGCRPAAADSRWSPAELAYEPANALVPGAQRARRISMHRCSWSSRSRGGREVQPVRRVLPGPPAGAQAAEGAAAAQRVQGGDRLGDDARERGR